MTNRKSYHLKAGNIKNLRIVEENLPDPAANEVTIEVKAIGLNFADLFAIWGLYGATPKGVFIPGLEYSGIVLKTGSDVRDLKAGDRIMGITRFGAYTTHLNIDQRYAIPLPEDWTFQEGAAYLVQMLTAYYGLVYLGALQQGSTVLIHSAAGGVGLWANRISKQFNAFTIGSVGRESKVDFLKKEGYDKVIVRGNDFAEKLKESLASRELNLVMECIGGKIFEAGYQQMAQMGRMVVYGSARYASPGDRPNYLKIIYQFLTRPKIDPQKMIEQNKAILGFNLIWLYEKVELLHQILKEVENLDLGKPHVGHEFYFENMVDAIKLFQTGKTIGKVVVSVREAVEGS
ncbi:MAG: NADPH:quinone reductase-like Zn-dependent oxidoreductase [Saprospiraceae bacterium]|jgi:NADPH:quinone reductase-like Zn-dependent oxidoreductase